jgi:hypothetical protein
MVHLLKTARPNYHHGEQKANSICSPYVRLFRPTCLRGHSQLAKYSPESLQVPFHRRSVLLFPAGTQSRGSHTNANLLDFFILKRKGSKSVKGPRITSRQQESLKKIRNFRACTLVPLIPSKGLKDNKGSDQAKNHNQWYESQDELQVSYAQGGNC